MTIAKTVLTLSLVLCLAASLHVNYVQYRTINEQAKSLQFVGDAYSKQFVASWKK